MMGNTRTVFGFWGGILIAIFVTLVSLGMINPAWAAPSLLTGIIGLIGGIISLISGIGSLMRE